MATRHTKDQAKPEPIVTVRELTPEEHVAKAMEQLGLNLEDENFNDTPERWINYVQEFMQPFNPGELLSVGFGLAGEFHGMVVQNNIPFRGMCAHHLLPYLGHASIGYVPSKRVVGLSKMARLVEAVGLEKPSLQEHQTDLIADILMEHLEPKGVIVVVSAIHTCMGARGVAAPDVPTTTSSVRGIYRDVPAAREEFFSLIKLNERGR